MSSAGSSSGGKHHSVGQALPSPQSEQELYSLQDDDAIPREHVDITDANAHESGTKNGLEGLTDVFGEALSDEELLSRPNRYHGPSSTWRNWTKQERDIANSLDRLQARDLGVHLYNAHALRLRAQAIRQELPDIGPSSKSAKRARDASVWEPPAKWAAWPVSMANVPREGQEGWERPAEKGEVIRCPAPDLSSRQVLEDTIISIASRKARERFKDREWEKPEAAPRKPSVAPHYSPEIETESGLSEAEQHPGRRPRSVSVISKVSRAVSKSGSLGSVSRRSSQASNMPLEPVPLADDAQTTLLLRHPARHLLSRLDDLLAGLHKAREAYVYHNYNAEKADAIDCEGQARSPGRDHSDARSPRPLKRQRSSNLQDSNAKDLPEEDAGKHRGKTRRLHTTNEPQVARGRSNSRRARSRSRFTSSRSISRKAKSTRFQQNLKLRDWSDVLGMAAIIGWDEEVLMRARKRCESLFQEKIDFVDLRPLSDQGDQDEDGWKTEDELDDGVHVDGFLQPIKARRGWRGKDKGTRAKRGTKVVTPKQPRGRPKKQAVDD